MSTVASLLDLARRYRDATGIAASTLSTRVFNDGKVIGRLGEGGDITTGRAAAAVVWFSENWPDKAEWPFDVTRPLARVETVAAEAAA